MTDLHDDFSGTRQSASRRPRQLSKKNVFKVSGPGAARCEPFEAARPDDFFVCYLANRAEPRLRLSHVFSRVAPYTPKKAFQLEKTLAARFEA